MIHIENILWYAVHWNITLQLINISNRATLDYFCIALLLRLLVVAYWGLLANGHIHRAIEACIVCLLVVLILLEAIIFEILLREDMMNVAT